MKQNLHVEILYHEVGTDFEMEFQLSGCCRMRLTTERTETKKEFLKTLSAAVTRSRIIIATGKLFSDEGLIKTVAAAINKPTVMSNAGEYGMVGDSEIEIISGSVPLINNEGIFGGCIIESGPQSIILLTDNRSVRKSIMKTLIHPYVAEISILPEDEVMSEPEEISEQTAEKILEALEESALEESALEEIAEEDPPEEPPKEESEPMEELEMFVEPGFAKERFKGGYYGERPEEYDDMGIFVGNDDDLPPVEDPKKASKATLWAAFSTVMCIICVAVIVYLLFVIPIITGQDSGEYIRELFTPETPVEIYRK